MEDDVLAKVISAEKEIQDCLETEKAKARQWLEEVRKEVEQEAAKAEDCIKKALHESMEQTRYETTAKADALIRDTADRVERLLKLSDETLGGIVMRRVRMILPE